MNNKNIEILLKDLISQVSALQKEINILKNNKLSNEQSRTNTMLKPEDDQDVYIRQRHEKYVVDKENDIVIPSTNSEYSEELLIKKEQESRNIFDNLSSDFKVEKSSLNENKSIENISDIFTDDLPDLEKVPGEIVLNSLLKGSMIQ